MVYRKPIYKYTQHTHLGVLLLLVLLITDEALVSVGLSGLRSSGPLVIHLIEEKERMSIFNP